MLEKDGQNERDMCMKEKKREGEGEDSGKHLWDAEKSTLNRKGLPTVDQLKRMGELPRKQRLPKMDQLSPDAKHQMMHLERMRRIRKTANAELEKLNEQTTKLRDMQERAIGRRAKPKSGMAL